MAALGNSQISSEAKRACSNFVQICNFQPGFLQWSLLGITMQHSLLWYFASTSVAHFKLEHHKVVPYYPFSVNMPGWHSWHRRVLHKCVNLWLNGFITSETQILVLLLEVQGSIILGKSFNFLVTQIGELLEIIVFQEGKGNQVAIRKDFYVSILGKLSKRVQKKKKKRDPISKVPLICCDFVSHFKYLLPPPNFVFTDWYSFFF